MSRGNFKKKRTNQGENVSPPVTANEQIDKEPPVFSMRYLDKNYGLEQCEKEEKVALISKMAKLSQMTWQEIRSAPRHGLGYEKIARSSLNVAIPSFIPDDANILAFRFSGMKPMLGYKEGAVFYITWLDRDFTVYDH